MLYVIFLQQSNHPDYRFQDRGFSNIRDLLDYHIKSQIPITRASGVILSKPVSRVDKWIFHHSDIKLDRKITGGVLGEIFEGVIVSANRQVAIKTCQSKSDKFLQLAKMLKQFKHPNIVQLLGIAAENEKNLCYHGVYA